MRPLFALMNRALQQDSRLWKSALMRAAIPIILLFVLIVLNTETRNATGLTFASWLMWLNYFVITIAGCTWLAAAISEEREQRTLGLLRMSGVNSVSLLVGKWLPRVFVLQILLLLQLPLAVLAITMGGVTQKQLFAGYIGLSAYLLMMASVALVWSTVCSRTRRASGWVSLCWGLHACAPTLMTYLVMMLSGPSGAGERGQWIVMLCARMRRYSLLSRMDSILSITSSEPLIEAQVLSNLIIAGVALIIAWVVIEFITVYNVEAPDSKPLTLGDWARRAGQLFSWSGKPGAKRSESRVKHLDRTWSWPLAWKDFHFTTGGWKWFWGKCVFYAGLSLVIAVAISTQGFSNSMSDLDQFLSGSLMMTGGIGVLIELARLAGTVFCADVHSTAWPDIVRLPHPMSWISYTKIAGAALSLIPAAATFLSGGFLEPEHLANFLDAWFSEPGGVMTCVVVFYLHLTVYISLHLRHGAALIGGVCVFLALSMATMVMFRAGDGGSAIVIIGSISGAIFLHFRIRDDLISRAAR